ncbi:MAG: ATP-binding protein [Planctomycetota bacterium]|nr:ATP-binding protein [Planctomycetota bacterium]MDA1163393.1 ATP-binding protein [Planctomycetota bacterium]
MQQLQGFRSCLASTAESMRKVQDHIAQLLTQLEYPDRDRFSVRLALEEALANAIKHGNHRDELKNFKIRCQATSEQIEIEICDEGSGFALEQVRSPIDKDCLLNANGRGIALMERFMDRVEFHSNGSCVLLQKQRSPLAD